jgi:phenolic acid decarboxylase
MGNMQLSGHELHNNYLLDGKAEAYVKNTKLQSYTVVGNSINLEYVTIYSADDKPIGSGIIRVNYPYPKGTGVSTKIL